MTAAASLEVDGADRARDVALALIDAIASQADSRCIRMEMATAAAVNVALKAVIHANRRLADRGMLIRIVAMPSILDDDCNWNDAQRLALDLEVEPASW